MGRNKMMLRSVGPVEGMRPPPAIDRSEMRAATPRLGKRKAESQDNSNNNERLSKRLSLLNLGRYSSYLCPERMIVFV